MRDDEERGGSIFNPCTRAWKQCKLVLITSTLEQLDGALNISDDAGGAGTGAYRGAAVGN